MNNEGEAEQCTTASPPPPAITRKLLSKLAVCDDCKRAWPVAHIDGRTDNLVPHEFGHLVHLWLERHLFCNSVRFCASDQVRGAAYEPMDGSGDLSRSVEELREEFSRRGFHARPEGVTLPQPEREAARRLNR